MATYNERWGLECQNYVKGIVDDDFCLKYEFSNLTVLQFFVNGTWYGGQQKADVMQSTGFNESQYDAFYNTSMPNSFGTILNQVNFNNS